MKKIALVTVCLLCLVGLAGVSCSSGVSSEASSGVSSDTSATTVSVSGWDDCRHGEVDDPYPGECHDYTDTNNDGICDHSQSYSE